MPEYDDGGKKPIKQVPIKEEKEAQEKEEEEKREVVKAAKTQGRPTYRSLDQTKSLLQQRKDVWNIRKRKKEVPLLKRLQKNLIIKKKRAGQ